ncbi:MAG: PAS domain S-box protein, partial [bacterium]|nr:PAS domain S-box protein [bacterium]
MTAETMSHEQLLQENAVLQKQNEELSAAVSYWKNIYNSVNDVVFILNPQGTITQCNAATLRFFQLPEHEIVGRTCWSLIHGTSAPLDNCPFVRMLKTHRRETLIYESGNRILEIKADPIMGGSDSPQGAVHVVADVTARIRSEEARRDSEERFRAIAESSVDAIFITNEENIIFWNNAATRIFGFAKEDVIGKSTDLLMPEQVRV